MPNEVVEVEDRHGSLQRMRVPCPAFNKMVRGHSLDLFRYRLANLPEAGDEVRFRYVAPSGPLKGIRSGMVTRRNGGYIYVLVNQTRGDTLDFFEREVYDNEIIGMADEAFMLEHGEP
jgi:hypothetical protein